MRFSGLVLLLLLLLFPSLAHAGDAERAEALFEEGLALLREGDFELACSKFAKSMHADPSVGALGNLARCHERQKKLAMALEEYQQTVRLAEAAGDSKRARTARAMAERLEALVPQINIVLSAELASEQPEGLKVSLNGLPLDGRTLDTPRRLDVGVQTVDVTAPGHFAWHHSVELHEGEHVRIEVPLLESIAEAQVETRPLHVAGITLTAGGAITLVVGALLGSIVLTRTAELKDDCPDGLCATEEQLRAIEPELQRLGRMGDASTALLVLGGVAGAAGVTLLVWTEQSSRVPQVGYRIGVGAGPGTIGLTSRWTW